MKVKVNDLVLVTAGKNRGKTGKVLRVYKKTGRITVEKVNYRTRHVKKRVGQAGQKLQYEAPLNISNVAVICPKCKKATRIGYLRPESGMKMRVCKKCKESIDQKIEKKLKK